MILRNPIKLPTAARLRLRRRPARLAALPAGRRRPPLPAPDRRPLTSGGRRPGPSPTAGRCASAASSSTPAARRSPDQPVEVVETFAAGADVRRAADHGPHRRRRRLRHPPRARTLAAGRGAASPAPAPSPVPPARGSGWRSAPASASGLRPPTPDRRPLRSSSAAACSHAEARDPRTGRPIQLEFRVPGGTWSEFRTVQTYRRRPLPLPLLVHRRRQPRHPLPVPRRRPPTGGWPYRPGGLAPVAVTGH